MLTQKSSVLFEFLKENIEKLQMDAFGGCDLKYPKYDLYPRDYIKFAENELDKKTIESKINCISSLKRAIDCQTDLFLDAIGVGREIKKKNLRFEQKMAFIKAIGIFSQRSLIKLNKIRNKMEHDYSIPDVEELDVYYDLCLAYISNLEHAMKILQTVDCNYYIDDDDCEYKYFSIELQRKNGLSILYRIERYIEKERITTKEIMKFNEIEDFMFAFRCFYLMNLHTVSHKYVINQIEEYYISKVS